MSLKYACETSGHSSVWSSRITGTPLTHYESLRDSVKEPRGVGIGIGWLPHNRRPMGVPPTCDRATGCALAATTTTTPTRCAATGARCPRPTASTLLQCGRRCGRVAVSSSAGGGGAGGGGVLQRLELSSPHLGVKPWPRERQRPLCRRRAPSGREPSTAGCLGCVKAACRASDRARGAAGAAGNGRHDAGHPGHAEHPGHEHGADANVGHAGHGALPRVQSAAHRPPPAARRPPRGRQALACWGRLACWGQGLPSGEGPCSRARVAASRACGPLPPPPAGRGDARAHAAHAARHARGHVHTHTHVLSASPPHFSHPRTVAPSRQMQNMQGMPQGMLPGAPGSPPMMPTANGGGMGPPPHHQV